MRIAVTDDGCGISRDEAEHLFKHFAQLTSAAAGGSGLGLLLCAQLAATLGGYICLRCRLPPTGQDGGGHGLGLSFFSFFLRCSRWQGLLGDIVDLAT